MAIWILARSLLLRCVYCSPGFESGIYIGKLKGYRRFAGRPPAKETWPMTFGMMQKGDTRLRGKKHGHGRSIWRGWQGDFVWELTNEEQGMPLPIMKWETTLTYVIVEKNHIFLMDTNGHHVWTWEKFTIKPYSDNLQEFLHTTMFMIWSCTCI